ncbi:unnamed protein product, partial [Symbiodinium sp. CCMP2456]
RICFAAGMFLNMVLGPVLDVSGYAFAPASVSAPSTGLNIIISTMPLGQPPPGATTEPYSFAQVPQNSLGQDRTSHTRRTADALSSHRHPDRVRECNLSVVFKDAQTEQWTLERSQDALLRWRSLAYFLTFTLWIVLNLRALAHFPDGSAVRGFSLGAISGSLAGNMWCTRLGAVFAKECFTGTCARTWSNWLPWAIALEPYSSPLQACPTWQDASASMRLSSCSQPSKARASC